MASTETLGSFQSQFVPEWRNPQHRKPSTSFTFSSRTQKPQKRTERSQSQPQQKYSYIAPVPSTYRTNPQPISKQNEGRKTSNKQRSSSNSMPQPQISQNTNISGFPHSLPTRKGNVFSPDGSDDDDEDNKDYPQRIYKITGPNECKTDEEDGILLNGIRLNLSEENFSEHMLFLQKWLYLNYEYSCWSKKETIIDELLCEVENSKDTSKSFVFGRDRATSKMIGKCIAELYGKCLEKELDHVPFRRRKVSKRDRFAIQKIVSSEEQLKRASSLQAKNLLCLFCHCSHECLDQHEGILYKTLHQTKVSPRPDQKESLEEKEPPKIQIQGKNSHHSSITVPTVSVEERNPQPTSQPKESHFEPKTKVLEKIIMGSTEENASKAVPKKVFEENVPSTSSSLWSWFSSPKVVDKKPQVYKQFDQSNQSYFPAF